MTNLSVAFTALADPSRRQIFELIATRPSAVGEIAERMPISRPAVSQHLKVLREAGLVRCESLGTSNVYHLDTEGIAVMRRYLDRFWDGALEAFKTTVERKQD